MDCTNEGESVKPARPDWEIWPNLPQPFGYSYLLDMYDCRPGAADDMELTYRFLEELVDRLNMTRMSQPFVIHAPTKNGVELFPGEGRRVRLGAAD